MVSGTFFWMIWKTWLWVMVMKVWPSRGWLLVYISAAAPLPPRLLTTTISWPKTRRPRSIIIRVVMSVPPPGPAWVITFSVFDGNSSSANALRANPVPSARPPMPAAPAFRKPRRVGRSNCVMAFLPRWTVSARSLRFYSSFCVRFSRLLLSGSTFQPSVRPGSQASSSSVFRNRLSPSSM